MGEGCTIYLYDKVGRADYSFMNTIRKNLEPGILGVRRYKHLMSE